MLIHARVVLPAAPRLEAPTGSQVRGGGLARSSFWELRVSLKNLRFEKKTEVLSNSDENPDGVREAAERLNSAGGTTKMR